MGRMYESYKLTITDDNGTRDVRMNKTVDKSCYRTMLKFYNECKKRNSNNDNINGINFIGIKVDGSENIMFTKTYIAKVEEAVTEEVKDDLNTSTDEIIGKIQELLNLLGEKKSYCNDMISALDKKQDILLHSVELSGELSPDKKLELLSSLEKARKDRRHIKEELGKIRVVDRMVNIDESIEIFSKIEIPIDTNQYKFLDSKELSSRKMFEEIKYNSEKDRIHKMKQIENKYGKIVVDKINNTLICYNKCNLKK